MKRTIVVAIVTFVILWMLFGFAATAQEPPPNDGWQFLDGPTAPGGYVTDLAISPVTPEHIFTLVQDTAGYNRDSSDSFLFYSNNNALTWQRIYTFTNSVVNLALDPNNPAVLLAGGEDVLYRSNDSGLTWTQVYTIGQAIHITPDGAIYAAGQISPPNSECYPGVIGIAQSLDDGATWRMLTDICAEQVTKIVSVPEPDNAVYVVGWGREDRRAFLLQSQNDGETWRNLFENDVSYPSIRHALSDFTINPTNPSILFLCDEFGLIRSLDEGETWERIRSSPPFPRGVVQTSGRLITAEDGTGFSVVTTAPPEDFYALTFASNGVLYVAERRGYDDDAHIYRSDDSGNTWWLALEALPRGVSRLIAHPRQPEKLYAGLKGFGVYGSDTGAGHWIAANHGLRTLVSVQDMAVDPANPARLYAAADEPGAGLFRSDYHGLTWTTVITDVRLTTVALDPTTPETGWAGGPNGFYIFQGRNFWPYPYLFSVVTDIAISPIDPDRRYVGGHTGQSPSRGYVGYYVPPHDENQGYWSISFPPETAYVWSIAIHPDDPLTVYACVVLNGKQSAILRSQDGGLTWETLFRTGLFPGLIKIVVDNRPPYTLYAMKYQERLYISIDDGDTWQTRLLPPYPALALILDDFGVPILATTGGIFRWNDVTNDWDQLSTDAIKANVLFITDGMNPALFAGTRTGLWRKDMPCQQIWMPLMQRR